MCYVGWNTDTAIADPCRWDKIMEKKRLKKRICTKNNNFKIPVNCEMSQSITKNVIKIMYSSSLVEQWLALVYLCLNCYFDGFQLPSRLLAEENVLLVLERKSAVHSKLHYRNVWNCVGLKNVHHKYIWYRMLLHSRWLWPWPWSF